MRIEEIWDKWMQYDDDGFACGIRSDAPDEVKAAYEKHLAEVEAENDGGYMLK